MRIALEHPHCGLSVGCVDPILPGHPNVHELSVDPSASIPDHIAGSQIPAPPCNERVEVYPVIPRHQRALGIDWVPVILRFENKLDLSVWSQPGASVAFRYLVARGGEHVGATGSQNTHNFSQRNFWVEYVFEHILSDKKVKRCVR